MPSSAFSGLWDLVRGLIKAPQRLTSAAVLLLPAVRLLPCPPSLLATLKHGQKPEVHRAVHSSFSR